MKLINHMVRIESNKNVKQALFVEGFYQELIDMSKKLDES